MERKKQNVCGGCQDHEVLNAMKSRSMFYDSAKSNDGKEVNDGVDDCDNDCFGGCIGVILMIVAMLLKKMVFMVVVMVVQYLHRHVHILGYYALCQAIVSVILQDKSQAQAP
eukprot:8074783-Ditylum_brightwellii.AAC.1